MSLRPRSKALSSNSIPLDRNNACNTVCKSLVIGQSHHSLKSLLIRVFVVHALSTIPIYI